MGDIEKILSNYFDFRAFTKVFANITFDSYNSDSDSVNTSMSGGARKSFWLAIFLIVNVYLYSVNGSFEFSFARILPYLVVGVSVYIILTIFIHFLNDGSNEEAPRYQVNVIYMHLFIVFCILTLIQSTAYRISIQNFINVNFLTASPSSISFANFLFSLFISFVAALPILANYIKCKNLNKARRFSWLLFLGCLFFNSLVVFIFVFKSAEIFLPMPA